MPDTENGLAPQVEELLTAVLRGEAAPWPPNASGEVERRILVAARAHGVQALLAHMFQRCGSGARWPKGVRAALAADARALALAEPLRYLDLKQVLAALDEAGVHPLLLKGGHLAYAHYPSPSLRPCSDTDLLIRQADRQAAMNVMGALGYRAGTDVSGELVTHQFRYVREDQYRLRHEYDIHWKISQPQLFAHQLSFEELAREAVAIPSLGAGARGPSPTHAMLLACIHRVAHHYNSPRLIWFYDIHVLGSGMRADQFRSFAELAAEKRVRAICASGLQLAQRRFGTPVPSFVIEALSAQGGSDQLEPSAAFLNDGRRQVDLLISDLRCLPGWRSRLRLLREHLFPPPVYMLAASGVSHPVLLPFLYARRIVRGAAKWFRSEPLRPPPHRSARGSGATGCRP